MILYFADRNMNIIGQASTELPEGLVVTQDLKTEDVETGVAVFECTIPYDSKTMDQVKKCTEVGNYILRSNRDENEFYTIIETEADTKDQSVYMYAEDAGLDLLNEVVGAYEADQDYPIRYYIEKFSFDSGFTIGINEASNLSRKLSWEGESTASERITSVATQFDNCEISYSFKVEGLVVTGKYINIYRKRGKDDGVQLHLNREIDSIITKKSIANLATALLCTGGTPEPEEGETTEEKPPITLDGYAYDDGNYHTSGPYLMSREALKKWSRYVWINEPNKTGDVGHIVKTFSYDTTSQQELCNRALTELKKACEIEVNYEVEISKLPENVRIGDRVNIIDDSGQLYLSTRILKLENSIADQTQKATLGEFLIKGSGIAQKVADLAEQFAQNSLSADRALQIAKKAKEDADAAKKKAESATADADKAQQAADAAQQSADTAKQSAAEATAKADEAEKAVGGVVESVNALETTVKKAQEAADNAYLAADTAEKKAQEAAQAAANAGKDAEEAKTAAGTAQSTADSAIAKAETAQGTAAEAQTQAAGASATATAAKEDAAKAQEEIKNLGSELTTLSQTMVADYARKTDLSEAEAKLQTQITQNADTISSTASKVEIIDETANTAAAQAAEANKTAAEAQKQADAATAGATAAQSAADTAAAAAASAQAQADAAKSAAATAQEVASKADKDLAAAKADLETVTNRVGATEEEIAEAQQKVTEAQAAADKAKADAESAVSKATTAQTQADTAVQNATVAQQAANDAASKANLAQKTADEAKGDAAAAKAAADAAATTAAEAQRTADTAKTNATAAQAAADKAAEDAAAAQKAAADADAKADTAAQDLEAAKQNLQDVTNRVGATEEEVAAAQAAVDVAQKAADKAAADATAAQEKADEAKQNATAAQQAADNAKTTADKAQADAAAAQKAADKAQADADALAVRVTQAETKITQNSEAIELSASKIQEVDDNLDKNYYTRTETDAKIKVVSDSITSTVKTEVSQEVGKIQIGAKNLVLDSKDKVTSMSYSIKKYYLSEKWIEGETYTISFKGTKKEGSFLICRDSGTKNITFEAPYNEDRGMYIYTFECPPKHVDDTGENMISFYNYPNTASHDCTIESVKLEKGNKATDWTPAPEDMATGEEVGNAQASADKAQQSADATGSRVTVAESTIKQLSDSISHLVTDKNGTSLMTQTSNGWTFNMGQISDTLDQAASELDKLSGSVDGIDDTINKLNSVVDDLGKKTAYIVMTTDESGNPCIELGKEGNPFKVRITNTSVDFMDGSSKVAYVSNKALYIEKAIIKDELQIGEGSGFVWKRRSNGNMGLRWVEG